MSEDDSTTQGRSTGRLNRRTVLQSAALGGILGFTGSATGSPPDETGASGSFPPSGITEYGRAVDLSGGEVRTFTTETPSGEPKYHGVEFDRAALDPAGLPTPEELAAADNDADTDKYRRGGQAAVVHFKNSLQFFVPFPDAAATPFTFLGLNWNPGGHFGGAGAWLKPHFDVHFHMLDPATVDAVTGPELPPYDEGNGKYESGGPAPDPNGAVVSTGFDYEQLPTGYARSPEVVADQRYITDMGEHTAPVDAPELPDGPGQPGTPEAFDNTLIQGFIAPNGNDPRLAFVEPMLTREFLADVSGTNRYEVPQPGIYPHDQQHPQAYEVRDVPSTDTVVVVLGDFEPTS